MDCPHVESPYTKTPAMLPEHLQQTELKK